jgi:hypothetical protein
MPAPNPPPAKATVKATAEALKHVDAEALGQLNANIDLDPIRGLTFTFQRKALYSR